MIKRMLNIDVWLWVVVFFSAALSRAYFPFVPTYYGQRLFLYVSFATITLIFLLRGKILIPRLSLKWTTWLIVFIILQLGTMWYTVLEHRRDTSQFLRDVIAFGAFIAIIFFHYYVIKVLWRYAGNIKYFVISLYVILGFALAANFLQLGYMVSPKVFDAPVQLFANTLEARWGGEVEGAQIHRFYIEGGSYVKTNMRLSGITEEASENVGLLFVIFVPFLLARMRSRPGTGSVWTYVDTFLFFVVLAVFLLSRSSTGVVMAIFSLLMFVFCGRRRWSIRAMISTAGAIVAFGCIAWLIASRMENLSYYLFKIFDLKNGSINSRAAVSLSMWRIFTEHPLFGVGKGGISRYVFDYLPSWSLANAEIQLFIDSNYVPTLSEILGLLCEYGIIGVAIIIFFAVSQFKKVPASDTSFAAIYARLFVLALVIVCIFHFVWYKSIILCILFILIEINRDNCNSQRDSVNHKSERLRFSGRC